MTLHIYAQEAWHCEAFIVGDIDSLTKLRDKLTQAIDEGASLHTDMTSDGEGYNTIVLVSDPSEIEQCSVPYTAYYAARSFAVPDSLLDKYQEQVNEYMRGIQINNDRT